MAVGWKREWVREMWIMIFMVYLDCNGMNVSARDKT
jgi:hypothetical protein